MLTDPHIQWLLSPKSGIEIGLKFSPCFFVLPTPGSGPEPGRQTVCDPVHFELNTALLVMAILHRPTALKTPVPIFHWLQAAPTRYRDKSSCTHFWQTAWTTIGFQ